MKEVFILNLKDFKALKTSEKVELVNKRLAELKDLGLTTKKFNNEELDMSYDFVRDHLKPLGYQFNRDAYAFLAKEDTEQQENEVVSMELSAEEFKLLKEILSERKAKGDVNSFEDIVKGISDQNLKATSVKLRDGVASDWAEFTQKWGFYNSSDLISAALVHFMKSFPTK